MFSEDAQRVAPRTVAFAMSMLDWNWIGLSDE